MFSSVVLPAFGAAKAASTPAAGVGAVKGALSPPPASASVPAGAGVKPPGSPRAPSSHAPPPPGTQQRAPPTHRPKSPPKTVASVAGVSPTAVSSSSAAGAVPGAATAMPVATLHPPPPVAQTSLLLSPLVMSPPVPVYRPPVSPRVAVIGGGIAGTVAALYLAEHGATVDLYERADAIFTGSSQIPAHLYSGVMYADKGDATVVHCMTDAILFAKGFPFCINPRPTVVALDKKDVRTPQLIENACILNRKIYEEASKKDPMNQVFEEPERFYRTYTRVQVQAAVEKIRRAGGGTGESVPTTAQLQKQQQQQAQQAVAAAAAAVSGGVPRPRSKRPKGTVHASPPLVIEDDRWIASFAAHTDLDQLQYPIFLVREYGLDMRHAAGFMEQLVCEHPSIRLLLQTSVQGLELVSKDGDIGSVCDTRCGPVILHSSTKDGPRRASYDVVVDASGRDLGTLESQLGIARERHVDIKLAGLFKCVGEKVAPQQPAPQPQTQVHGGMRPAPQAMTRAALSQSHSSSQQQHATFPGIRLGDPIYMPEAYILGGMGPAFQGQSYMSHVSPINPAAHGEDGFMVINVTHADATYIQDGKRSNGGRGRVELVDCPLAVRVLQSDPPTHAARLKRMIELLRVRHPSISSRLEPVRGIPGTVDIVGAGFESRESGIDPHREHRFVSLNLTKAGSAAGVALKLCAELYNYRSVYKIDMEPPTDLAFMPENLARAVAATRARYNALGFRKRAAGTFWSARNGALLQQGATEEDDDLSDSDNDISRAVSLVASRRSAISLQKHTSLHHADNHAFSVVGSWRSSSSLLPRTFTGTAAATAGNAFSGLADIVDAFDEVGGW